MSCLLAFDRQGIWTWPVSFFIVRYRKVTLQSALPSRGSTTYSAPLSVSWSLAAHELIHSVMEGRPQFFNNLPLSSQFFFTPVPTYAAWWQRHKGVNNLPKVVAQQSSVTSRSLVWRFTHTATVSPWFHSSTVHQISASNASSKLYQPNHCCEPGRVAQCVRLCHTGRKTPASYQIPRNSGISPAQGTRYTLTLKCIVTAITFWQGSHLCRVAGNTVWSHMACDFL